MLHRSPLHLLLYSVPPHDIMKQVSSSPRYMWGNGGSERLSNSLLNGFPPESCLQAFAAFASTVRYIRDLHGNRAIKFQGT